jgi:hypothetical protein
MKLVFRDHSPAGNGAGARSSAILALAGGRSSALRSDFALVFSALVYRGWHALSSPKRF